MKIRDEIISSRQNPTVKLALSLTEKKHREEQGLFRADGIKLAKEALLHGAEIRLVLIKRSAAERVVEIFEHRPDCEAVILEDGVFDKISEEKSPEGVICILKYLDNLRKIATINKSEAFLIGSDNGRIMLLESLRDPGNMGTVIRSAAALGCERLIVSADCADLYNPKTVRASMGALFGLKVDKVDSLPAAIGIIRGQGRRVYAAALDRDAVGLDKMKLKSGDCFVIGNEGHGLSQEVIKACDGSVFIPIADRTESLNAATAASIILWEQKRQENN